jgi:disulfide bond formation protein DsbB
VSQATDFPASAAPPASVWSRAALAVSSAGLAGSLSLSWGLALKACPLCFYQRAFVMALVAVLGMGLLVRAARPERLSLLALPLAVAGLGVALFHVLLEVAGKLECPAGLLGAGTAPEQSLAVFLTLAALLIADALRRPVGRNAWAGLAGGVALGLLLAAASCTSNPPPPTAPSEPYAKPPDVCRPPFRSPGP